jgi:multidrug efflux pump subunit AcrA (membrane-fusion protein)
MTATKPKTLRFNPWWGVGAATVIVAGLLGTGVIKLPTQPNAASTAKLETVEVSQSTFRVGVSGSGTLNAVTTLDLKPKISGTITQLPSEGKRVTKGELVARLDDSSFVRNLHSPRPKRNLKAPVRAKSTTAPTSNKRSRARSRNFRTRRPKWRAPRRTFRTPVTCSTLVAELRKVYKMPNGV